MMVEQDAAACAAVPVIAALLGEALTHFDEIAVVAAYCSQDQNGL